MDGHYLSVKSPIYRAVFPFMYFIHVNVLSVLFIVYKTAIDYLCSLKKKIKVWLNSANTSERIIYYLLQYIFCDLFSIVLLFYVNCFFYFLLQRILFISLAQYILSLSYLFHYIFVIFEIDT